jgi:hypothetical protein
MEAIPMEVIDMADDFFSHLNSKERNKISDNYYLEQPHLSKLYRDWLPFIKNKNTNENSQYLYLIICRSYKYYAVEMPVISNKVVMATHARFVVMTKEKVNPPLTAFDMLTKMKTVIGQESLVDYLILKLHGNDETPVLYKSQEDLQTIFTQIIVLLLALNDEIKKHISNETT